MANPRVAIVVPCYNEAKRLPVRRFEEFFQKSDIDFLFVDDGSRDNTKEVLNALRDRFPGKVAVIVQERNCGKAEAVRRGMSGAIERGYEFAGFWDADLATPLGEIREFLQLSDIYWCSRNRLFFCAKRIPVPMHKKLRAFLS